MAETGENNTPDLISFTSQQENPLSVGWMSWLIWVDLESFPSSELSGSACFCFLHPSMLVAHAESQPLVF